MIMKGWITSEYAMITFNYTKPVYIENNKQRSTPLTVDILINQIFLSLYHCDKRRVWYPLIFWIRPFIFVVWIVWNLLFWGFLITDYVVWAMVIVEDRTVTNRCYILSLILKLNKERQHWGTFEKNYFCFIKSIFKRLKSYKVTMIISIKIFLAILYIVCLYQFIFGKHSNLLICL